MSRPKLYTLEEIAELTGISKDILKQRHKRNIVSANLVGNPFISLNAYDILFGDLTKKLTPDELGVWVKLLCCAALSEANGAITTNLDIAKEEYKRLQGDDE